MPEEPARQRDAAAVLETVWNGEAFSSFTAQSPGHAKADLDWNPKEKTK